MEDPHVISLNDSHTAFSLLLDVLIPLGSLRQYSDMRTTDILGVLLLTQKYELGTLHALLVSVCETRLPHSLQTLRLLQTYDDLSLACLVIIHSEIVRELEKYVPLAYYAIATRNWKESIQPRIEQLSASTLMKLHNGRNTLYKNFKFEIESASRGVGVDTFECAAQSGICDRGNWYLWVSDPRRHDQPQV